MAKRKSSATAETPSPAAPPPSLPAPPPNYTVLARRYRPQQFKELVGQEATARALIAALESNRVAHAYLFTGNRGVGKTSAARILAKALNCVKGPTPIPCDECDICKSIAAGEDVDVLEIDGASNRGIDEVREIRQNLQFCPSRSRHKIYIIDEVHMLTREAFNALLKTLEEPPAHVKFIFATTEVQKIPVTILSRCQRFDFAGIRTSLIVDRLREVVAAERMQADEEALEMIARRAGGSMRDAQSLLDQLLAFGGERLTSEQVHGLLGTAHDDRVASLAGAILHHDVKQALDLLRQAADDGLQLGELLDQLLTYWRDLMVVHCAGEDARDVSVPSRHRPALRQQARALALDTILAGLDILASTRARLRASSHARALVEMAIVRLGRLEELVALSQLAQWIGQVPGSRPETNSPPPPPPSLSASLVQPPEAVKKKPGTPPDGNSATLLPLTEANVARIWPEILAQIGGFLANDVQKAGLPAISGPNTLVFRFPPEYNHSREHCQDPVQASRLEERVRKITGQPWSVRVESAAGNSAAPPTELFPPDTESSSSRSQRQRAEAEKEPLIKRAMDVLGAQIVRLDEGFNTAPVALADRTEEAEGED